MFHLSSGIPRLINIICDRALLGAYSKGSTEISKNLIKQADSEIKGELVSTLSKKWSIFILSFLIVSIIIFIFKLGYLNIHSINNVLKNFLGQ